MANENVINQAEDKNMVQEAPKNEQPAQTPAPEKKGFFSRVGEKVDVVNTKVSPTVKKVGMAILKVAGAAAVFIAGEIIGEKIGESRASQGEVLGLPEGEVAPMTDYEDLTGIDVNSTLE